MSVMVAGRAGRLCWPLLFLVYQPFAFELVNVYVCISPTVAVGDAAGLLWRYPLL